MLDAMTGRARAIQLGVAHNRLDARHRTALG